MIFGFEDIFPSENNEVGSTEARRNYKCADVVEAAGVTINYPKQIKDATQLNVPGKEQLELRPSNT